MPLDLDLFWKNLLDLMHRPFILKGNYSGREGKTLWAWMQGRMEGGLGNAPDERETLVHFAFVLIKTLRSTNICFPTLNPTAEEL